MLLHNYNWWRHNRTKQDVRKQAMMRPQSKASLSNSAVAVREAGGVSDFWPSATDLKC